MPFQYAFAMRAGVRTYRPASTIIRARTTAEELERGCPSPSRAPSTSTGNLRPHRRRRFRWLRDLSWRAPPSAGIFYEPMRRWARSPSSAPTRARPAHYRRGGVTAPGAALAAKSDALHSRDPVHVREAQCRTAGASTSASTPGGSRHVLQRPEVPRHAADLRPDEAHGRRRPRAHRCSSRSRGERPVFTTLVSTGAQATPPRPAEPPR